MGALLFIAALVFGVSAYRSRRRWKQAQELVNKLTRDAAQHLSKETELSNEIIGLTNQAATLRADLENANSRVAQLSKYQSILDIQAFLAEQRNLANKTVADAMRQAEVTRARAQDELAEAQADARAKATAKIQEADRKLQEAYERASEIVDAATKQAKEIAGDAYAAKQNAKHYEETAQAMKNVIEGYGDRYLIPAFSVLDELGDEYEFADAGARLKRARENVRDMIKRGKAATCEYVEDNRRETAINFVLDAFNGKCDTVLSDVRDDNFGTLQQKLKDAFQLVNHHGEAFRNAKVESAFLNARIEELRWAVAVHELKLREREEQRAIKERIREEEKAQRDFDKAMKEAAKDEAAIRKAMDKAQTEIANATAAQREKYEAKLAELNEKLRIAEEKNRRALSMAQQTKAGHVYIISNEGSFGENVYKIGLTRRLEPQDRIRELGDASVPFSFDVHALIRSEDAPALERELQKRFLRNQVNKVNPKKEFFRVPLSEIKKAAEAIGCIASWTMTAASHEYRETLVSVRGTALFPIARRALTV